MTGSWTELSGALVALVKDAASAVVRVEGGRRGAASGVVWSADGTIVTVSHGLEPDDDVVIGLPSGETARAVVAGRDPSTDLAVVRAERGALGSVSSVAWGDAPAEVGQLVLSLTRPGRGPKAGLGLVSRVGDPWHTPWGGKLDRYVELDLGVHPGFSGGLVLDLAGRGLGLATAGLVRGAALAVGPPTLRRVVKSLLAHGAVRRGYLGVSSVPARLPASAAAELGPQHAALLVTGVEEDSPAARGGVLVGDLLAALDGHPLEEAGDLIPLLEEERIGDVARVRLVRGGAVQEIQVTIGARDAARGARCGP